MEVVHEILSKRGNYKPTTVEKHLELDYDVGRLLASDSNDLDAQRLRTSCDDYLTALTRDNVQLLMNRIFELPTERVDDVLVARLPAPRHLLPRARPVPKPKPLTKWQQFALDKGIKKTKKSKLNWDEQLQKWIPAYGYKRAAAEHDKSWVLEVPQNADPFEDQFEKRATVKSEKVAKNELQRLRNVAKARNIKVPRKGILNPEVASAKELQTAVTVARASTASVGKFQAGLPKEKVATNVHSLIPGGSRKRKMAPVSGEVEKKEILDMVESVLNKRPKIDIEMAVSRKIKQKQSVHEDEEPTERTKGGGGGGGGGGRKKGGGSGGKRMSSASAKGGKKPKSGKGVHKGLGNKGRKRR